MSGDAEVHGSLSAALRAFAVEVEQYVHAAGGVEAIHRTDLTALAHAMDAGREGDHLTPGELAARMGLSPSATTTMLDRLESAGHVVRSRTSSDRRLVTVTVTDRALETGARIFLPLAKAFDSVMSRYSPEELRRFEQFLGEISAATASARDDVVRREPPAPGADRAP
jgi:DNA-binding MarR family transcriptional regulator